MEERASAADKTFTNQKKNIMNTKSIGFIGAGRITRIFLQALKNKNVSLKNISVFDTDKEVAKKLKTQFSDIQVTDTKTVSGKEIVFIALHPPVIMETLGKIKNYVSENSTIISLAPKITIEKITAALGNKNIVRLIPNATSVINEGYNPVCFAENISDKKEILEFLSNLGKTFETEESKLEAYAIASAMLPTYFWFQWFEMIEIGKQIGLSEKESTEAVKQTLKASINTAFNSGLKPEEVFDLIPVKPIGEHETEIKRILNSKLIGLYQKIKA
jgi:pyrroline-5-carboxylate reductase